jgi:hypothetical protein
MATTTEEIIPEILPEQEFLGIPTSEGQFQAQHCYFSEPVYYRRESNALLPVIGSNLTRSEIWNFSEQVCFSSTTELISNPTTGGKFYLDKTLDYGQAIIIWFLTIFSFYLIFKTAYNFFWKK